MASGSQTSASPGHSDATIHTLRDPPAHAYLLQSSTTSTLSPRLCANSATCAPPRLPLCRRALPSAPMRIGPLNPTTTDEIDRVLEEFLRAHFDPLTLANRLGVSPLKLIDFLARPDVAQRLDKLHQLLTFAQHLREAHARATALSTLQRIIEDESTDPTERCRAATTLLRATNRDAKRATRATSGPPLLSSNRARNTNHPQPSKDSPPREAGAKRSFPHQHTSSVQRTDSPLRHPDEPAPPAPTEEHHKHPSARASLPPRAQASPRSDHRAHTAPPPLGRSPPRTQARPTPSPQYRSTSRETPTRNGRCPARRHQ